MKRVVVFYLLLCMANMQAFASWTVSIEEDEFRGTKTCFVISDFVGPTKSQQSPFKNIKQKIGIGINSSSIWIYIDHNINPQFMSMNLIDFDNFKSSMDVKFDYKNYIEYINMEKKYDNTYLVIKNEDLDNFVINLSNSNQLMTSLSLYGQDRSTYFKHNLSGFMNAFTQAKKQCNNEYDPIKSQRKSRIYKQLFECQRNAKGYVELAEKNSDYSYYIKAETYLDEYRKIIRENRDILGNSHDNVNQLFYEYFHYSRFFDKDRFFNR